jgi:hypothetical protein
MLDETSDRGRDRAPPDCYATYASASDCRMARIERIGFFEDDKLARWDTTPPHQQDNQAIRSDMVRIA